MHLGAPAIGACIAAEANSADYVPGEGTTFIQIACEGSRLAVRPIGDSAIEFVSVAKCEDLPIREQ